MGEDKSKQTSIQLLSPIILKNILNEYHFKTITYKVFPRQKSVRAYFMLVASSDESMVSN